MSPSHHKESAQSMTSWRPTFTTMPASTSTRARPECGMPPAPNHQTSPRWGPMSGSATPTCPPHTKGSQFSERQSGHPCLSSTSSNTRTTLISNCYNASPRSMTSKHHGCCCSFVPAPAAPTCYECVHQTAPKTSPKLTTPPLGPASNPCCRPRTSQPHPWP